MSNEWLEVNFNDFIFPIILIFFISWLVLLSKMQNKGILDKLNATKALGFILMLRTQKGIKLLEKISKPRKFWRIYGEVSLWVCRLSMLFIGLLVFLSIILFVINGPAEDPPPITTMIAVPGINPVIPLGWGIIAFIISLVIHEFGHGLLARAHGMRLRSFGLLVLGPLPLGAFAEPEYDELTRAPRKERQRMFAAGPSTNIFMALICFFMLVLVSSQFSAIHSGMHARGIIQHEQSGANSSGLEAYDIITHINNSKIENKESFDNALSKYSSGDNISLTIIPKDNLDSTMQLNVTLGDAYEYRYYNWNLSSGEDLNSDGQIGRDDFDIFLENNKDLFEEFGMSVEPGDAFLGVSQLVSSSNGIDRLAGPFAKDSTGNILSKTLFTPFHLMTLIFEPINNKGKAINSFEESMLVVDDEGISGFLGAENLILVIEFFFWLIWVNLLLGLTNLIPILPFDGGHLFRDMFYGSLENINRLRKAIGLKKWHPLRLEQFVNKITGWSSLALFFILILMLGLPYLVG
ncbi:MAG: hypothetical protein CMB56_004180 [Methanobacteriota archaeon]|nr:MAG: hypothetical protein CMB56_004180 [Euryarchaeota archaeon]